MLARAQAEAQECKEQAERERAEARDEADFTRAGARDELLERAETLEAAEKKAAEERSVILEGAEREAAEVVARGKAQAVALRKKAEVRLEEVVTYAGRHWTSCLSCGMCSAVA
ncbi:MAG: hypothetical protein H0U32_02165 [Thermoleophilaceae bacterium]|nr:hypothetical protein [Thermoleophilaceae bacterium]